MATNTIFVGFIVSSKSLKTLNILNGFVAVENGLIVKVGSKSEYAALKQSGSLQGYTTVELTHHQFLMPGFVDCHTHAPQYPNIGLGLDRPLLEWLDKYTFPLEKKYEDVDFASSVYDQVVRRLLKNGTTSACYFGSLHLEGTLELVQRVVKYGQRALVGKVSMNIANDAGYYNDTDKEIADVKEFIQRVLALKNDLVEPVVTPRFAVSCNEELMTALAKIAKDNDCRIQSHISENHGEIQHVLRTNPGAGSYAQVYDRSNLLTDKCIMAHAVHVSEGEMRVLARRGAAVAHCPASNTRLLSGLCPLRALLARGVAVGLGTDVSGGDSASILDAMRRAMDVSAHRALLAGTGAGTGTGAGAGTVAGTGTEEEAPVDWREVFFLATLGGAKALRLDDKIGDFQVGKQLDALVVDVFSRGGPVDAFDYSVDDSEEDKVCSLLQRFIYLGDDRNILQVYVKGVEVKTALC